MSLRELAARIGVNHAYISDIEHDRRVPSERVLRALAGQLGLDIDNVMALTGRFGEKADRYIRRHQQAGALIRQISDDDLTDGDLLKLMAAAKRLSKKK